MLRSYVCPTTRRDSGGVPIRMRVGDGEEHEIGTISEPDGLPELLRAVAEFFDSQAAQD